MAKRVYHGMEAMRGMAAGVELMARTVRSTLGPHNRNVVLNRRYMRPVYSNDGSSIATEFILENKLQNLGVQFFRKVANSVEDGIGDGATTTILLAWEMIRLGMATLAAGASARHVTRGMRRACAQAIAAVEAVSRPLEALGESAVEQVAVLAAHDDAVGKLVAEAFRGVGPGGLIQVEPGHGVRSWVEVVTGMTWDEGYVTPRLLPDPATPKLDLKAPFVLVYDGELRNADDMIPALNVVKQLALPLLIVAEEISGEALTVLILNNLRGIVRAFAARGPGFGGKRGQQMLEDIACITGAETLSAARGYKPEHFHEGMLGRVARAVLTDKSTTFWGGSGHQAAREARAKGLEQERLCFTSEFDREMLTQRIGWLRGGVAIIRPGAASVASLREVRFRTDDAVAAVRAAHAGGVVAGGGKAYLEAAQAIQRDGLSDEAAMGARLLARSLQVPLRQMADNAGLQGRAVVEEVKALPPGEGLNLMTMARGDLMAAGIADPTRIVTEAIRKGVSLAALILECQAAIVDLTPDLELGENREFQQQHMETQEALGLNPQATQHDNPFGGLFGDQSGRRQR